MLTTITEIGIEILKPRKAAIHLALFVFAFWGGIGKGTNLVANTAMQRIGRQVKILINRAIAVIIQSVAGFIGRPVIGHAFDRAPLALRKALLALSFQASVANVTRAG